VGRVSVVLLAGAVLAACGSPESTRLRGGGPGADPGNVGQVVRMHEGSRPYHETPRIIGDQGPPLDPAQHARAFEYDRR
jgi:hypothetical protein